MALIDEASSCRAVREFEAQVVILHHSTTICNGYQPVIHCGAVRQSAEMIAIHGRETLKTGERATVRCVILLWQHNRLIVSSLTNIVLVAQIPAHVQIGRASCRERVCQYV